MNPDTGIVIGISLIINSVLLGIGLAMDAFSISIANGLEEPSMRKGRVCGIASVYAIFQFAMPLIGWFCVHSVAELFKTFQPFIPWISLVLLVGIGSKMVWEGFSKKAHNEEENKSPVKLGITVLIVQGLATSIDALSVGFTIADYRFSEAFLSSAIIGFVTFAICVSGLVFGKKLGEKFSDKATIIGGLILIGIGIEIFIKSFY